MIARALATSLLTISLLPSSSAATMRVESLAYQSAVSWFASNDHEVSVDARTYAGSGLDDNTVWYQVPQDVVCIRIEHSAARMYELACGALALNIDPLFRTAEVTGSLDSFVYEFGVPDPVAESSIALDLVWVGEGPWMPGQQFDEDILLFPPELAACIRALSIVGLQRDARLVAQVTSTFFGPHATDRDFGWFWRTVHGTADVRNGDRCIG